MSKQTELKCPMCGSLIMQVKNCKDVKIVCRDCNAMLLISKADDGSCTVSARPSNTAA